ncbi:MAG: anti-sigma factor domain-containing protein, partial [Bacteroidia bacterium]
MKKLNLFGLITSAAIIFSGCSKEDDLEKSAELSDNDLIRNGKKKIEYNISGLEPLGRNYRYEGWIIVNGMPVSTGTFKVTPSGNIAPPIGIVNANDLAAATAFVLTIEPHPDPNPAPSNHKILAGDFSGNTATITVGHPAALGN